MNLFKFLGFVFRLLTGSSSRKFISKDTERKITAEWNNIADLIKGKSPSQLRQALISADKTLDNALRDLVEGESMGQRLKNSRHMFDNVTYSKIWEAHKVRNNLVHEAGYDPPYYMIIESIENLRNGLQSLRIKV